MSDLGLVTALKAQKETKKLTAPKNIVDYNAGTTVLSVYSKYGKGKDIMFRFQKLTVNQLFGLYRVYTNPNSSPVPNAFSYVAPTVVPIANGQTDWISPYTIRATANGDGSPEQFTGGAHSSDNNSTTGNPTAVTDKIFIYVDGKRIAGTNIYQAYDRVEIFVKNKIMAYNTKTLNRYTHEEYVRYTIQGGKIDVNVRIVPLEQLAWKIYYSLQAVITYYSHIMYPHGQYTTEQVVVNGGGTVLATDAGAKTSNFVDTVILSKSGYTDYLELKIDNFVGMGKREFVDNTIPLTFTTNVGKVYNKLVGDTEKIINPGEVYEWKGYYKFYNLD